MEELIAEIGSEAEVFVEYFAIWRREQTRDAIAELAATAPPDVQNDFRILAVSPLNKNGLNAYIALGKEGKLETALWEKVKETVAWMRVAEYAEELETGKKVKTYEEEKSPENLLRALPLSLLQECWKEYTAESEEEEEEEAAVVAARAERSARSIKAREKFKTGDRVKKDGKYGVMLKPVKVKTGFRLPDRAVVTVVEMQKTKPLWNKLTKSMMYGYYDEFERL